MAEILPFAPLPALLAFVLLALTPLRLGRDLVLTAGVGGGLLSAAVLAVTLAGCREGGCTGDAVLPIFRLDIGGIAAEIAMTLDPLSMLGGVTVAAVGALVLIYAGSYMAKEETADLRRFFALMNLFLSGMLTVVLAADALLLFFGWELIGLCSFYLIAYYTRIPKAVAAGRKALVVTRAADTLLLAGLMLLALETGTTRFDGMLAGAPEIRDLPLGVIAGLIAAGALGKSAQFPFQTWLPSAMTGPTPVSALLHSATMVAAGVILLARLAPLFEAAPEIAAAVSVVGVATAALGALVAVGQGDIKKMLAYSTISQIGFMVLALGVGAADAALTHFAVHAAFKSLLFLSAGVLSRAAGGSTAIEDLRGSLHREPLAFWGFALGAASLAGLPVVTAGWFSKEAVLAAVWVSGPWGAGLWVLAATGAILTGTYAFRAVFVLASPGAERDVPAAGGLAVWGPLLVLAAVAIGGGLAVDELIRFVGHEPREIPKFVAFIAAAAPFLGAVIAWRLTARPLLFRRLGSTLRLGGAQRLDAIYYVVFVRGFRQLTRTLAGSEAGQARPATDLVGRVPLLAARRLLQAVVPPLSPDHLDRAYDRSAGALAALAARARRMQTGRLRDYALGLALGAVALLLLAWGSSCC